MSGARLSLDVAASALLALAYAAQLVRWLRVLQREHYEPSSMHRFLARWTSPPVGAARAGEQSAFARPVTASHVLGVALIVALALDRDLWAVGVAVLYGLFCPRGLSLRGRTGALVWTRRARTVAIGATALSLVVAAAGALSARPWLAALAMVVVVPLTLELVTRLVAPVERRRADVFVAQARERLARVGPRVVGITGSYGKTSTKSHLADLLGPEGAVVATPRSFNNRAGLSRAINEQLAEGTRVFIAEMGTYGPGEIAELCSWCPPEVAVVTSIGPVHLERMGRLEVVEEAKYEITGPARAVVLNVDDPRLARWVERLVAAGKRVRTAGSRSDAAVRVEVGDDAWRILVEGRAVATFAPPPGVQPTNLACALAAALELGVDLERVVARLGSVGAVANRGIVATAPSGVVVVDDTFNANPASAAAALGLLSSLGARRRVVVTPGLVEMGEEATGANREVGRLVAAAGDELVVVARTNARALAQGYAKPVRRFDHLDGAVAWVRAQLGPGDAVLYLNDLPDHYP